MRLRLFTRSLVSIFTWCRPPSTEESSWRAFYRLLCEKPGIIDLAEMLELREGNMPATRLC